MPLPSQGPSVLISRLLPEEAVARARSRVVVDLHEADQPLEPAELTSRLKGRQGLVCLITDAIGSVPGGLQEPGNPAPTVSIAGLFAQAQEQMGSLSGFTVKN